MAFNSSLGKGGGFANSVIGKIATGNISSTGSISGESAADSLTAVNEEIPGNVKIVKESEDGKISGIRLNISGNGVNEDVVTGPDGSITVKDLKPGTYTVSEYEYEGYVPLPPQTVTVVSGGTSIVIFSNLLQRGNLVVTKTSEDGLVEGHEFRLYGTSTTGQQVDMYAVSDSSGKAVFKDVPIGTYTLSEENTAVRYVIPEDQTDISRRDDESGNFGTQGECHPRRYQNAQSRVWSASAIPVLADHRLSCVSFLKTPFFCRIASRYSGFWATKKEGLLLTPNWRRNKPSSFTM